MKITFHSKDFADAFRRDLPVHPVRRVANMRPDAKRRLVYGQPFLLPRPLESYVDAQGKPKF